MKHTRKKNRKKLTFWRKVRRGILICAVVLFVVGLWWAYYNTVDMFDSRAGRMATWGAGALIEKPLDAVPVWFWSIVAGGAVYLWWRHRLIMSIVYGALAGLALAIM